MAFLSAGQVPRLQTGCLSHRVSLRSPAHCPLFTSRSRACAGPPDTSNSCSRVLPCPQPCFSPGLSSCSFSRPVLPAWRDVRQSCSASAPSSSSSSSSSSAFPQDPAFFDRKEEAAILFALLGSTPSRVSVVVGPRSSGKTALLKRVAARHYGKELDAFPREVPPGWLDGRKAELGSPRDMAAALHGMVGEEGSIVEGLKQVSLGFAGFTAGVTRMDPKVEDVTAVKSAVQSAEDFFLQYKQQKQPEDPFPLLVVDEANRMKGWDSESERKDILDCFVHAAKVDRTAHIILATSDYSFLSWISEGLRSNNMRVMVLGDFPKDEAKEFFTTKVLPPDTPVDDKEWDRIYQVCGGNPGLLVNTGSEFAVSKDWEISLESVMQPILMDVKKARKGKDFNHDEAYSPGQFKKVAQMLLDASPYHAVAWKKLAREIGGIGAPQPLSADDAELRGEEAVSAMVRADVLAYRPKSKLARDLPSQSDDVGTALTPGHLEAMRVLRQEGAL